MNKTYVTEEVETSENGIEMKKKYEISTNGFVIIDTYVEKYEKMGEGSNWVIVNRERTDDFSEIPHEGREYFIDQMLDDLDDFRTLIEKLNEAQLIQMVDENINKLAEFNIDNEE